MDEPAWAQFTPSKLIWSQQSSTDHAENCGSMAMGMQHVPVTRNPLIAESSINFLQDSNIIRSLSEPSHPFIQQEPVGGVPAKYIQGVCCPSHRCGGSHLRSWNIGFVSQLLSNLEGDVGRPEILSTILCASVLVCPFACSMKAPLDSLASGWIHN